MSEKVDIHMPIFIGDYLRDTGDLTTEEHGAYFLLLMSMWTARGSLPLTRLYLIAKVPAKRWGAVWGTIGRFFEVVGERVSQGRLLRELGLALTRVESARSNGRMGGRPKAKPNPDETGRLTDGVTHGQTGTEPRPKAKPNPDESSSSASGSPSFSDPIPSSSSQPPDQTRDPSAPRTAYGLTNLFGVLWEKRHGRMWQGQPTAARAATQFMDRTPAEVDQLAPMIRPALERFFADERAFYLERGHAFDLFVKDFDAHSGRAPPRRGDVRVGHAMAEVKQRASGEVKL